MGVITEIPPYTVMQWTRQKASEICQWLIKNGKPNLRIEYWAAGDTVDRLVLSSQESNGSYYGLEQGSERAELADRCQELLDHQRPDGFCAGAGEGTTGSILVTETERRLFEVRWDEEVYYQKEVLILGSFAGHSASGPESWQGLLSPVIWRGMLNLVHALGASSCLISYTGLGDLMEDEDFTFYGSDQKPLPLDLEKLKTPEAVAFKTYYNRHILGNDQIVGLDDSEGNRGEIIIQDTLENSSWEHWNRVTETDRKKLRFVVPVIGQPISEKALLRHENPNPVWD